MKDFILSKQTPTKEYARKVNSETLVASQSLGRNWQTVSRKRRERVGAVHEQPLENKKRAAEPGSDEVVLFQSNKARVGATQQKQEQEEGRATSRRRGRSGRRRGV